MSETTQLTSFPPDVVNSFNEIPTLQGVYINEAGEWYWNEVHGKKYGCEFYSRETVLATVVAETETNGEKKEPATDAASAELVASVIEPIIDAVPEPETSVKKGGK
jgi:hypothetical protein